MIVIKSQEDIRTMREGGAILAEVLHEVARHAVPDADTLSLDRMAQDLLVARGGTPAFKGYQGYPASLCVSINNEVVHGIPSREKKLRDGDVVGLDLGVLYKGFYTDMAVTVGVGKVSRTARRLIEVTRQALERGLRKVRAGATLGDIGNAVQSFVEKKGFGVVRSLVGHGVGTEVHEDPPVPNYGEAGTGAVLKAGMTLAIEPMVTVGDYAVSTLDDQWTVITDDGSLAAHFEHTIAVTERGYEILTRS